MLVTAVGVGSEVANGLLSAPILQYSTFAPSWSLKFLRFKHNIGPAANACIANLWKNTPRLSRFLLILP